MVFQQCQRNMKKRRRLDHVIKNRLNTSGESSPGKVETNGRFGDVSGSENNKTSPRLVSTKQSPTTSIASGGYASPIASPSATSNTLKMRSPPSGNDSMRPDTTIGERSTTTSGSLDLQQPAGALDDESELAALRATNLSEWTVR